LKSKQSIVEIQNNLQSNSNANSELQIGLAILRAATASKTQTTSFLCWLQGSDNKCSFRLPEITTSVDSFFSRQGMLMGSVARRESRPWK